MENMEPNWGLTIFVIGITIASLIVAFKKRNDFDE